MSLETKRENKKQAPHFNHAARRFKELRIKPEIPFLTLDLLFEELHPIFNEVSESFPRIIYIPKDASELREPKGHEKFIKGVIPMDKEVDVSLIWMEKGSKI